MGKISRRIRPEFKSKVIGLRGEFVFGTAVFFIALISGVMGALLGLGGGIFLVPLLTLFLDLPMKTAVGTSLVAVVATSLSASSTYIRKGLTNLRLGLLLETATSFGAVTGGYIAVFLHENVLALVFSIVAFYTAGSMLVDKNQPEYHKSCETGKEDPLNLSACFTDEVSGNTTTYRPRRPLAGSAASVVAGAISGLLGIGGGPVKVPVMKMLMGLPLKAATATSSFMVGITASTGALVYLSRGYIQEELTALTVFGTFVGAGLGVKVACSIRSRHLNMIFVIVLIIISVQMLLKGLGLKG